MNNNKQSSVRWLIEELDRFELGTSEFFSKAAIINHADRLHAKEIKDVFDAGKNNVLDQYSNPITKVITSEQYYNEIFGGNK